MTQAAHAVHQKIVPDIVATIISSVQSVGGDPLDMLIILESVIVGVLAIITKEDGEAHVMEEVTEGVLKRIPEIRLSMARAGGPR